VGTLARRLALAAFAVALLAVAGPAQAAEFNWAEANDIVASPDGRHVYAAGHQTLSFRVDQDSGALELIGHTEPGGHYHPSIAMARGGRFVYVATGSSTSSPEAIHVMSRDADSGLLTLEDTFRGRDDIAAVTALAASADGTQLYMGQGAPLALAVFDIDPNTGALTERQRLYAEDLPSAAYDIAPSADGRHVYLAGDSVGILARDPQTGLLSKSGTGHHHGTMWAVAMSPDDMRVYGGMTDVDTWRRDPGTGSLEFSSHDTRPGADDESCFMCDEGQFISVAPDGRAVFTSAETKRTLVQWRPTDTGLAYERRYVDGEGGVRGIANPMEMAWTPDGRFAFVVASVYRTTEYISSSGRNGSVAAFRRTPDGLQYVNSLGPGIEVPDIGCRPGSAGLRGVTIEDGALYTNSPDVTVSVLCAGGGSVKLSNVEGDFAGARAIRVVGSETRLPWRLDTSGAQRDVKRVHVRFITYQRGGPQGNDLLDDIILDQRPPEVITAQLRSSRLRLKARDNRSGVKRLQVTTSKSKPGKARGYTSKPKLKGSPRRVFVRVFDGAGNPSKWKVARRP
jgi:6-phosphogluconolactonase (cycloisomerase 2 family)